MPAPIGNTCPDIDRTQRRIQTIRVHIEDMTRYVQRELDDINDELEELRNGNSTLRDWGNELEEKVKSLEEELDYTNDLYLELKSTM